METPRQPLAAYCSYNGQYKRFRTFKDAIGGDVDYLLREFGLDATMRTNVYELLTANPPPRFDEGFKFETSYAVDDPTRVAVYATIPISFVDDDLPFADELPSVEQVRKAKKRSEPTGDGGWRASA